MAGLHLVRRYRVAAAGASSGGGGGGASFAIPATAGLLIAATRPEIKNFSYPQRSTTQSYGMNAKVPHRFPNGTGRYLLATYDNWGVPNKTVNGYTFPATYDNANPNDVTFDAQLSELDGSTFYQGRWARIRYLDGTIVELGATFADLPTGPITVPAGCSADAVFDLGFNRAPGSWLLEHHYRSATAGNWIMVHQAGLVGSRGETVTTGPGETNKTGQMFTGSKPNSAPDGAWASSIRHIDNPPVILRTPTIFVGDSLIAGSYGWWQYLSADTVPHVVLARGTEPAISPVSGDSRYAYRRALIGALGGFQRSGIQYVTNDLTNPRTLAQLLSYRDSLIAMVRGWASGVGQAIPMSSVMVGTLPPTAASDDAWATPAAQYLNLASGQRGAEEGPRLGYNADARTGTPYGSNTPHAWVHPNGFITADVGGAVEDIGASAHGTDSPSTIGRWKVQAAGPSTLDGLHPGTQPGRDAWAAAVPDIFFAA